jgi:hypothetical protein
MKVLRYLLATTVSVLSALLLVGLIGLWLKIAVAAFMLGWNLL